MQEFKTIAFLSSDSKEAQRAAAILTRRYHGVSPKEADVIVALGGDGFMLQTLHENMTSGQPIYGMNCGSVGFLMNEFSFDNLLERLAQATVNIIHPLRMVAVDAQGESHQALAINEVSLYRQRYQAAKLRIWIDDKERMEELICDGVLVATPAGSTAYNLSAHGPILPITAKLLALTPISPFRPRRWRGALLPDTARVRVEVLEPDKRPVSAVADHREFRDVREVKIEQAFDFSLRLLFDPGHALDERILLEQFQY